MSRYELAFPFHGDAVNQQGGSGLTKLEYFALHLMAGAAAKPKLLMNEYEHAKLALKRAKALLKVLEEEKE